MESQDRAAVAAATRAAAQKTMHDRIRAMREQKAAAQREMEQREQHESLSAGDSLSAAGHSESAHSHESSSTLTNSHATNKVLSPPTTKDLLARGLTMERSPLDRMTWIGVDDDGEEEDGEDGDGDGDVEDTPQANAHKQQLQRQQVAGLPYQSTTSTLASLAGPSAMSAAKADALFDALERDLQRQRVQRRRASSISNGSGSGSASGPGGGPLPRRPSSGSIRGDAAHVRRPSSGSVPPSSFSSFSAGRLRSYPSTSSLASTSSSNAPLASSASSKRPPPPPASAPPRTPLPSLPSSTRSSMMSPIGPPPAESLPPLPPAGRSSSRASAADSDAARSEVGRDGRQSQSPFAASDAGRQSQSPFAASSPRSSPAMQPDSDDEHAHDVEQLRVRDADADAGADSDDDGLSDVLHMSSRAEEDVRAFAGKSYEGRLHPTGRAEVDDDERRRRSLLTKSVGGLVQALEAEVDAWGDETTGLDGFVHSLPPRPSEDPGTQARQRIPTLVFHDEEGSPVRTFSEKPLPPIVVDEVPTTPSPTSLRNSAVSTSTNLYTVDPLRRPTSSDDLSGSDTEMSEGTAEGAIDGPRKKRRPLRRKQSAWGFESQRSAPSRAASSASLRSRARDPPGFGLGYAAGASSVPPPPLSAFGAPPRLSPSPNPSSPGGVQPPTAASFAFYEHAPDLPPFLPQGMTPRDLTGAGTWTAIMARAHSSTAPDARASLSGSLTPGSLVSSPRGSAGPVSMRQIAAETRARQEAEARIREHQASVFAGLSLRPFELHQRAYDEVRSGDTVAGESVRSVAARSSVGTLQSAYAAHGRSESTRSSVFQDTASTLDGEGSASRSMYSLASASELRLLQARSSLASIGSLGVGVGVGVGTVGLGIQRPSPDSDSLLYGPQPKVYADSAMQTSPTASDEEGEGEGGSRAEAGVGGEESAADADADAAPDFVPPSSSGHDDGFATALEEDPVSGGVGTESRTKEQLAKAARRQVSMLPDGPAPTPAAAWSDDEQPDTQHLQPRAPPRPPPIRRRSTLGVTPRRQSAAAQLLLQQMMQDEEAFLRDVAPAPRLAARKSRSSLGTPASRRSSGLSASVRSPNAPRSPSAAYAARDREREREREDIASASEYSDAESGDEAPVAVDDVSDAESGSAESDLDVSAPLEVLAERVGALEVLPRGEKRGRGARKDAADGSDAPPTPAQAGRRTISALPARARLSMAVPKPSPRNEPSTPAKKPRVTAPPATIGPSRLRTPSAAGAGVVSHLSAPRVRRAVSSVEMRRRAVERAESPEMPGAGAEEDDEDLMGLDLNAQLALQDDEDEDEEKMKMLRRRFERGKSADGVARNQLVESVAAVPPQEVPAVDSPVDVAAATLAENTPAPAPRPVIAKLDVSRDALAAPLLAHGGSSQGTSAQSSSVSLEDADDEMRRSVMTAATTASESESPACAVRAKEERADESAVPTQATVDHAEVGAAQSPPAGEGNAGASEVANAEQTPARRPSALRLPAARAPSTPTTTAKQLGAALSSPPAAALSSPTAAAHSSSPSLRPPSVASMASLATSGDESDTNHTLDQMPLPPTTIPSRPTGISRLRTPSRLPIHGGIPVVPSADSGTPTSPSPRLRPLNLTPGKPRSSLPRPGVSAIPPPSSYRPIGAKAPPPAVRRMKSVGDLPRATRTSVGNAGGMGGGVSGTTSPALPSPTLKNQRFSGPDIPPVPTYANAVAARRSSSSGTNASDAGSPTLRSRFSGTNMPPLPPHTASPRSSMLKQPRARTPSGGAPKRTQSPSTPHRPASVGRSGIPTPSSARHRSALPVPSARPREALP